MVCRRRSREIEKLAELGRVKSPFSSILLNLIGGSLCAGVLGNKGVMIYGGLRHVPIDQKGVAVRSRCDRFKVLRDKITIIVAAPLRPHHDKVSSSMGIIKCP